MADDSVARELHQFREDMRGDLADLKDDLKDDLARLLPREVYELRHEALARRVEAVEQARKDDAAQRRSDRRWLVGAVVIPVVVVLVQILVTIRGAP